jgi:hypothetical protein
MKILSRRVVTLFAFGLLAAARAAGAQTAATGADRGSLVLLPSETLARNPSAGLPLNLVAPPEVHLLAEQMWRRSPSFRRQAMRLAAAPGLRITISQGRARPAGMTRAETTCHREGGLVTRAEMWIPLGIEAVELLAHELEHIIEQLDDVDLPDLQKQAGSGVRTGPTPGQFETVRAITVGRLVAKEMWSRPVLMAAR